jgi:hypothetical protein
VQKTIHALRNPTVQRWGPIFAARNLFFVIDETELPSVEKLNDVLLPHWAILWRVCARGHYFHNSKPLVDQVPEKEVYDPFLDPPLPVFEERDCASSCPRQVWRFRFVPESTLEAGAHISHERIRDDLRIPGDDGAI